MKTKLIIINVLLVAAIASGCKKEEAVLEDPLKLKRALTIPLPLYDISFKPVDVFGVTALPSGMTMLNDSSINYIYDEPFEYEFEFPIAFDIKNLIKNEDQLELVDSLHIYVDFRNGSAFTITGVVDAINSDEQLIESLLSDYQKIWHAPDVSGDGVIGESVNNKITISLTNDRIRNIYDNDVAEFLVTAGISSANIEQMAVIPNLIKFPNREFIGMKFSVHLNKRN